MTQGVRDILRSYLGMLDVHADAGDVAARGVPVGTDAAGAATAADLCESLESFSLLVHTRTVRRRELTQLREPSLVQTADGQWLLLVPLEQHRVQVHDGASAGPRDMTWAQLPTACALPDLCSVIQARRRQQRRAPARAFGLAWFWQSLSQHRLLLGEVLLASLFVQVFALVTPLVFQVVIDKALTHRSMATLDVLAIALLGLAVFEVTLSAMRGYLFAHATHRVDVELGSRLFRHLMGLPMSYFDSRPSGDTVARVRELENARHFLTGTALTSWLDLAFAVVIMAVMFHYSTVLTLVVIAALPVLFAASWLVSPLMRSRLEDKFELGAANQGFLVETVGAMQTLKSHCAERHWRREWDRRQTALAHADFSAGQISNATQQFTGLASKLLTVVLLYFGARLVISGEMTVGALIAFNMLASRVNAPVLKLASVWQEYSQMKVSVQRLADILDSPTEGDMGMGAGKSASARAAPAVGGAVRLERVSLRYHDDGPDVLRDLSLDIRPGEVVGITGDSGAGKTTLVRLIQQLYAPQRGRVLIDGVEVGRHDAPWLRSQIGVVSQDGLLLDLSVRENIALGRPDMPLDEVMDSARLAGAHEFIMALPQGYDAMVGERGGRLSGGQRARVLIARALAMRPAIVLLDEATAALDYDSERAFHDNLQRIRQGRTVIIVAHRLSTLRRVDRVMVLHAGQLAECGPPRELAIGNGRYASLYRAHQMPEAA